MKKILLILVIVFIGASGRIEPRFNLNTISYYDYQPGRPHQGICLKNRSLSEIFSTLNQMTDPSGTLSEHKVSMYWKVYGKRNHFASGEWERGDAPIVYGFEPIMESR